MEHLNDLYRPEDLSRLEKKIKRERAWIWILAGATLALCVLFCCLTDSRNAGRMELAAEICSCLGGWLVIYRRIFGLQEAKHQREHVQHLLEAPRTSLRGRLTITKERMRIKNSIRFRVLLLDDGEQLRRLKVNETRVRLLRPFDGKEVTLELADGYVAGIEGEEASGAPAKGGRGRSLADFLKNIWTQLHRFVVWAILSTILWAWIFTLVTDTGPANKVTLYVQTEGCRDQALAEVLNEARPEGIRLIQVGLSGQLRPHRRGGAGPGRPGALHPGREELRHQAPRRRHRREHGGGLPGLRAGGGLLSVLQCEFAPPERRRRRRAEGGGGAAAAEMRRTR